MSEFLTEGGAAFPVEFCGEAGMTLRDYFAAAAVRGCAAAVYTDRLLKTLGSNEAVAAAVASAGYLIADAMLARRRQP